MPDIHTSALVWFRRDLRVTDHAALFHALKQHARVWCAFIFDSEILDPLPREDRRVTFIHDSLIELDEQLRHLARQAGAPSPDDVRLIVQHGPSRQLIPKLAAQLGVQTVYANHDDEPNSQDRDAQVRGRLSNEGIALYTLKDHVIFERNEVLTANDTPYSVFTPYQAKWLKKLDAFYVKGYQVARHAQHLAPLPPPLKPELAELIPSLRSLGFETPNTLKIPAGTSGAQVLLEDFLSRIDQYHEARDFPSIKGPSYLSTHLRFGTVSIRQVTELAWHRTHAGSKGAATWLSELIWRDFYHQILFHHPHVVDGAFKRPYDRIKWVGGNKGHALFQAWCEGRTGYPLVDAAMRQLNETGYMHNRLRMITASFLCKDLGIDWRRGEAYFAEKLLDFDLAANNGGWQWAASTGCDAQPYFRIFNPITQSERFDPAGKFILRYVPELSGLPTKVLHAPWRAPEQLAALKGRYPPPVVDHDVARQETLARYAAALDSTASNKPR